MSIQIVSQEHYQLIREMFDGVETSAKIISPFIGAEMAQLLTDSIEFNPNLEVEVITRFYREDFIKGVSKITALEKLNDAGARIYALHDLHTKLYLFDVDLALLGSANFTSGGFKLNHELSLYVEDENEVNSQLITYFNDLIKMIIQSGNFLLTAEKIAEEKRLVASILERRTEKYTQYRNKARFGARITIPSQSAETEQTDIIQTILSKNSHTEYNETIWLKFEGESRDLYSISDRYSPHITSRFPQGITYYPTNKRPSVVDGDYIYIAVVCMDERGHPVQPYIVGRGQSAGYSEGNVATSDMIEKYEWMARFSHYCPFVKFEYLNAPISECIPLSKVLQDLGTDTYVATIGKSLPMADLWTRHHQKTHLRLTVKTKNYIDSVFDDLVKKYGVQRITEDFSRHEIKYYLFNTNTPQNKIDMLRERKVASYYPRSGTGKDVIDLQKGDMVFIYENAIGIIAYGVVSGDFQRMEHNGNPDYEHFMKLVDCHELENPISPADMKKIAKQNLGFRGTMPSLPKVAAEAILKAIQEME